MGVPLGPAKKAPIRLQYFTLIAYLARNAYKMASRFARVMRSEKGAVTIKKSGYPLYIQLKVEQLKFIMEFINDRDFCFFNYICKVLA